MSNKYCYWSVADGDYVDMLQGCVNSARVAGDDTDFVVLTDRDKFDDAINIKIPPFSKNHYLFKFKLLKEVMADLDYDYFIFLDSDNYFVRKPDNPLHLLNDSTVHSFLESDCTDPNAIRGDWWGCPLPEYVKIMRDRGVTSRGVYNVNAGYFIVKKSSIEDFYNLGMEFWNYSKAQGYTFTEEAPLAYITHMFTDHMTDDPYQHTLMFRPNVWASDWTGVFKDHLPANREWDFTDYMTGKPIKVYPDIVHAMRSKNRIIQYGRN
jgi:hypothetical protein